ncbi:UNVERIFIED_CONTAM: hypothetical protein Slati_2891500 [Sesamum latifolium]|uniref:Retrotransposon Copia-like N-terminal domain-containing protein n=1 Tax=Sesamum latifolium TaxID=2727402 RepID=A0AAW2VCR7_9LAMI
MATTQSGSQADGASTIVSRQNLDNPQSNEGSGLTLVSSPLTGDNYLVWSRAIRFALRAKKKLSYIDGRTTRPADNSEELDEWIRNDYMVITWILNSVSKKIVDAFIYVSSARSLWLQLEARYGGSNGPMIYNWSEISSITQGDVCDRIFHKNNNAWDELTCLDPVPACTCNVHRQVSEREASRQLMRLMGLNVFDHVRSQILLMDPRPHVEKAFSMVHSVEKQLEVQVHIPENNAVYQVQQKGWKGKCVIDKRSIICDYWKKSGTPKGSMF